MRAVNYANFKLELAKMNRFRLKKELFISLTAGLLFSVLSSSVRSSDFVELLDVITTFADEFCGEIELKGESSVTTGNVGANASLTVANKKLFELGAGGSAPFTSEESFGVLREQLANENSNNRDCRKEVLKQFEKPLAAVGFGPTDSNSSATISKDLPVEFTVASTRPTRILDGTVLIHLSDVGSYKTINGSLNQKKARFFIERPNRGKLLFSLNSDRPTIKFDYRDTIYELELVHGNIADQILTAKISEQPD